MAIVYVPALWAEQLDHTVFGVISKAHRYYRLAPTQHARALSKVFVYVFPMHGFQTMRSDYISSVDQPIEKHCAPREVLRLGLIRI